MMSVDGDMKPLTFWFASCEPFQILFDLDLDLSVPRDPAVAVERFVSISDRRMYTYAAAR